VIPVVTKAQPAKFVSALRASHMHASLVFLNIDFALRALLRVKFKPNFVVIGSMIYFGYPLSKEITVDGTMSMP
jgi:hypothetical protein